MKVNPYLAILTAASLCASGAMADNKAPAKVTCLSGGYAMDAKGNIQNFVQSPFEVQLSLRNDGSWHARNQTPVQNNRTMIEYSVTIAPKKSILLKDEDLMVIRATVVTANVEKGGVSLKVLGSRLESSDRISDLKELDEIKKGSLQAGVQIENPEIGTILANQRQEMTTYQGFTSGVIPAGTAVEFTFNCMSLKAK